MSHGMQQAFEDVLRKAEVASNGRFTFKPEIIPVWMDLCAPYEFSAQQVRQAADVHFRESRMTLTPADLIEQAQKLDGGRRSGPSRLSPNPECSLCDDEGWVLDVDDRLGWVVPCDHFAGGRPIDPRPGHVAVRTPDGTVGHPRPRTPEEIEASLVNYWAGVREQHGGKTQRSRRRPEYDPDGWVGR